MLASYVLRLRVPELSAGRLVGVVLDVRSGEHTTIKNADELVEFCASHLRCAYKEREGGQ